MPDGTLIQWGNFTKTVSSGYTEHVLTYPINFVSAPSLSVLPVVWGDPTLYTVIERSLFQASGTLRLGYTGSGTSDMTYVWTAVGRWK